MLPDTELLPVRQCLENSTENPCSVSNTVEVYKNIQEFVRLQRKGRE